MDTFNPIVFLWQLSLVLSLITLIFGLIKKHWISLLISSLTFLPIAYYFNGANNAFRLVALIPIILLILTFVFWKKAKR